VSFVLFAKGTVCFRVPKGFLPLFGREVWRCPFCLARRKYRDSRKNVQIDSVVFTRTNSAHTHTSVYVAAYDSPFEGDKNAKGRKDLITDCRNLY
jgi:hypothetical protein